MFLAGGLFTDTAKRLVIAEESFKFLVTSLLQPVEWDYRESKCT